MMRKAFVAVIFLIILSPISLAEPIEGREKIYINPGKILQVSVQLLPQQDTIFSLQLYGRIEAFTITSQLEGVPLYNLTSNSLVLLARKGDIINVTYISVFEGEPSQIDVNAWNQTLEIYIHSDYILLGLEPTPDTIEKRGDYTLILFDKLSEDLSLSLLEAPSGETKTSGGGASGSQVSNGIIVVILVIIIVAVITMLFYLAVTRRRERSAFLTEEERAIIEFIRKNGGKAYIKDIREYFDLPSTTALRRIRRLEEKGLVKTEKTPGGLVVFLD